MKKTFDKITNAQLAGKGVTALADKPNAGKGYGQGGLSAAALKAWFDKLSLLIADKYNTVAEELAGDEAAKYITVEGVPNIETLYDLITALGTGAFAGFLKAYASADAESLSSLQTILNGLAEDVAGAVQTGTKITRFAVNVTSTAAGTAPTVSLTTKPDGGYLLSLGLPRGDAGVGAQVVQETGQDTEKVMSQKAATDSFTPKTVSQTFTVETHSSRTLIGKIATVPANKWYAVDKAAVTGVDYASYCTVETATANTWSTDAEVKPYTVRYSGDSPTDLYAYATDSRAPRNVTVTCKVMILP